MAKTCSTCVKYYAVKIYAGNKKQKETNQGHCLEKTVYASNRSGSPVYPPNAKIAELPHGLHKIALVSKFQDADNCPFHKEKK